MELKELKLQKGDTVFCNYKNVNYIAIYDKEEAIIVLNDIQKSTYILKSFNTEDLYKISDVFYINLDNISYISKHWNNKKINTINFLNGVECNITEEDLENILKNI
jgi:hypothetical protein